MAKSKMTKSQFIAAVAGKAGLEKKQATAALTALNEVVVSQLKKGGPGEVTIPGLIKLLVAVRPATKERKGINPFTGQEAVFKAKPARKVIKSRAVKSFKDA